MRTAWVICRVTYKPEAGSPANLEVFLVTLISRAHAEECIVQHSKPGEKWTILEVLTKL